MSGEIIGCQRAYPRAPLILNLNHWSVEALGTLTLERLKHLGTQRSGYNPVLGTSPAARVDGKPPDKGVSRFTVTSRPVTALNSRSMISPTTTSADAFTTTQSKTGSATMLCR